MSYDYEDLKELRERLLNAQRTINDALGTIEGDPRIIAEFGKRVDLEDAFFKLRHILSVPEGKDLVKWAETMVRQLESDLEDVTEERDDARVQCDAAIARSKDLEKKLKVATAMREGLQERSDVLTDIRAKYGISAYVKLEEWINILIQKAGGVPPVSASYVIPPLPACPSCGCRVDKAIMDCLNISGIEHYLDNPVVLCCASCTTCFRLSRREGGGFDVLQIHPQKKEG